MHRQNVSYWWKNRKDHLTNNQGLDNNSARHHNPRALHRLESHPSHQSRDAPCLHPGQRRHQNPASMKAAQENPPINPNQIPQESYPRKTSHSLDLKNRIPPEIPYETPQKPLAPHENVNFQRSQY